MNEDDNIILDQAVQYLRLAHGVDRASVECKIKKIAFFFREEVRASVSKRREERESLARLTKAVKELRRCVQTTKEFRRALKAMDEAAYIEVFGYYDAPMSGIDYDRLLDLTKRFQETLQGAKQASYLSKVHAGAPRKLAQQELVIRCLAMFDERRPGKATTYQDGDFTEFTQLVHMLATGEEHSLERQIKYVLGLYKSEED